jgi:hypothetical protein
VSYDSPEQQEEFNKADAHMKDSEFYIREKIELGILAQRISKPWV